MYIGSGALFFRLISKHCVPQLQQNRIVLTDVQGLQPHNSELRLDGEHPKALSWKTSIYLIYEQVE